MGVNSPKPTVLVELVDVVPTWAIGGESSQRLFNRRPDLQSVLEALESLASQSK
jgi:hypothetical protein